MKSSNVARVLNEIGELGHPRAGFEGMPRKRFGRLSHVDRRVGTTVDPAHRRLSLVRQVVALRVHCPLVVLLRSGRRARVALSVSLVATTAVDPDGRSFCPRPSRSTRSSRQMLTLAQLTPVPGRATVSRKRVRRLLRSAGRSGTRSSSPPRTSQSHPGHRHLSASLLRRPADRRRTILNHARTVLTRAVGLRRASRCAAGSSRFSMTWSCGMM